MDTSEIVRQDFMKMLPRSGASGRQTYGSWLICPQNKTLRITFRAKVGLRAAFSSITSAARTSRLSQSSAESYPERSSRLP